MYVYIYISLSLSIYIYIYVYLKAAARIHRARALIEAEHPGGLSADWSLSPAALGVLGTPVMQGQAGRMGENDGCSEDGSDEEKR